MKNLFEQPRLELVRFGVEDIVTASTLIDGGKGDGGSTTWPFNA